ncbi:hypothetical protein MHF_0369 [Mycoplasma haemofelis Ohio2]|uniref:Uncharacterized protein n=1 Tax=Mycoplasma haemofelis (strain Ohio2) TaxID=859194 RepID=F6FH41_MYCHI|nr:hypothetical protein MHF_0369 [Mycoplasma haemofelis Ohio2]
MNKFGALALLSAGGAGTSYAGYSYWASGSEGKKTVTIG